MRGPAASKLASRLDAADDDAQVQHILARTTGNYRRANERRSG
ncbi:MAG: ABC transporter ATP-binding protein [Ilumatobacteraceae bacterium]